MLLLYIMTSSPSKMLNHYLRLRIFINHSLFCHGRTLHGPLLRIPSLGTLFFLAAAAKKGTVTPKFFILLRERIEVIKGHTSVSHTLRGAATEKVG